MNLAVANYNDQRGAWPATGRHILAQYDDRSIIVYQAYRPSIGQYAIEHQRFGGDFSYSRMSWIKPNFLWMMYRCGWGQKEGQEVILGLRLRRGFFEKILAQAVSSTYHLGEYPSHEAWQEAVSCSDVRLQWDPDHDPRGSKLDRRAVQVGLRGKAVHAFGQDELLEVIDMTSFVVEQRGNALARGYAGLLTPVERVYLPADPAARARLGLGEDAGASGT